MDGGPGKVGETRDFGQMQGLARVRGANAMDWADVWTFSVAMIRMLGLVRERVLRFMRFGRIFRGAVALLLAAAAPCLLAGEAASITVVSFGGSYARASVKAYHERFTEATGVRVKLEDYNGGLSQIRAQVETGNIVWDVVDMDNGDTMLGCDEGLLLEMDRGSLPPAPDGTPAEEDFMAGYALDCGVELLLFSVVYAYNAEKLAGREPTRMADFFDLEKFPGRRGMRRAPNVNLEMALVADGVPANEVYAVLSEPQGIERAFRKLDSIKNEVVWWETGAHPPQMLADGEVVMSTAFNGRIFNAWALEKQPLAIVWDGQVLAATYLNVVAGSPNEALARQFVAFASSTQSMANLTGHISYGPLRRSAIALVGKHFEKGIEMAPHLPNFPPNMANAVLEDPEWWADNQDELNERFTAWLLK